MAKRKPSPPDVGRLEKLLAWLDKESETLAAGDGDREAAMHAFAFWQCWPLTLGAIVTAAVDSCGESDDGKHWQWRLQLALRRTVNQAVHLLACEAERENIDTIAVWRAHQIVDDLLANAVLKFPLPADRRRLVSAEEYRTWREGDAVVARLATRMDVRIGDAPILQKSARQKQSKVDIVGVLQEAGRRMTTTEILDALAAKGLVASTGTTKNTLAAMTDCGELTNDRYAKPRGYGLPGWGQS